MFTKSRQNSCKIFRFKIKENFRFNFWTKNLLLFCLDFMIKVKMCKTKIPSTGRNRAKRVAAGIRVWAWHRRFRRLSQNDPLWSDLYRMHLIHLQRNKKMTFKQNSQKFKNYYLVGHDDTGSSILHCRTSQTNKINQLETQHWKM